MSHSPARREAFLRQMLPPNQRSIPRLVREQGILEPTLYAWRSKARSEDRLMPDSNNTPEGWSSRDEFSAVFEAVNMSRARFHLVSARSSKSVGSVVGIFLMSAMDNSTEQPTVKWRLWPVAGPRRDQLHPFGSQALISAFYLAFEP